MAGRSTDYLSLAGRYADYLAVRYTYYVNIGRKIYRLSIIWQVNIQIM